MLRPDPANDPESAAEETAGEKRGRRKHKSRRNKYRYLAGFVLGVLATGALTGLMSSIPDGPARRPELSQADTASDGNPAAPSSGNGGISTAQTFANQPTDAARSTGPALSRQPSASAAPAAIPGSGAPAVQADPPPLPAEFLRIVESDRQHPRSVSALHDDFSGQPRPAASALAEQRLALALAPLARKRGFHISAVECRSTLCEVRADGAVMADGQLWWRVIGEFYSLPASRGYGAASYAQTEAPPRRYVLMLIGAPRR